VNAIIEVPIGGEPIKYEMDKKAGTLRQDDPGSVLEIVASSFQRNWG
jgi:hypothetical protein